MALSLFALWMLLEYSADPFWLKLLAAGMGLAAAVAIRKNTLIFVIACILVWSVAGASRRRICYLGVLLVLAAAAAAGIILPRKFYEYRAKNTMGGGVPAIAYIAMGTQWEEGRSPGGWNGYHSDLFMECSFDEELTSRISKEAVKDSLRYMVEHPAYMAEFYYYKLIEQWEREDFWCLSETVDFYGERTPAAWEIYEGEAKGKFLAVMSVHQSLIYLGACCFCVSGVVYWRRRKAGEKSADEGEIERLVLLVTFIGGFLFSVIWEAGARYVMPYFVMLMPYAAESLADISRHIRVIHSS